jgi:hypothetical protein
MINICCSLLTHPEVECQQLKGPQKVTGWKELLTTLVDHFATPVPELMGMECPGPSADLPKSDQ